MDTDTKTILLRCRNDEQLKQWLGFIINLKKSITATTPKIDLISAPQTPRMELNHPLLHYDEDEEDYYDDHLLTPRFNHPNDNEYQVESTEDNFMRNRSYSYQYGGNNNQSRGYEVSSRKASLPSQSTTTARHFMNGVPGMTLPPLPRSPTNNLPTLSNSNVSTVHNSHLSSEATTLYSFPSSPPGSHPSSPTTPSSLRSTPPVTTPNGISPSGALWQRRQQQPETEEQQQQQHIVVQPSLSQEIKKKHARARSQSSPNIQRPILPHHNTVAPELPTSTYQYDNAKRKSNGYRYEGNVASPNDITKVKVHYFGAIYVVVVPTDIEFTDLQRRIESKIKLCGQEFESFGLKYEDEDGDLITISSSEDVQMGFENKGPNNAVNLFVTQH